MRTSILAWPATFVLASLAAIALGCETLSANDPEPDTCEEPKPEVPPDAWCPPVYQCIDGEWVDTSGGCPEPECPSSKPGNGTTCPFVGQACAYQEDVCGQYIDVTCTKDGWDSFAWVDCPPDCPDDLPLAGTGCIGWDYGYSCEYVVQTSCGEEDVRLSCSFEENKNVWTVDSPSTCAICKDHGSEAACATSEECMWLTAGCGDEPLQTGCYPKTGCDVAGCNDDSICAETSYNPCYNQPCDACGASYFACLPGWAP